MTQATSHKKDDAKFKIVFAIYPGMTHLDFTGPHQFLSRTPSSETVVASPAGGPVEADGLTFANTVRIADVRSCDLICVPGGVYATKVAQDAAWRTEYIDVTDELNALYRANSMMKK